MDKEEYKWHVRLVQDRYLIYKLTFKQAEQVLSMRRKGIFILASIFFLPGKNGIMNRQYLKRFLR